MSDQPRVHVSFVVTRQLPFIIMCFLFRSEVKKLIIRLNDEKEVLEKKGIYVDGKNYKIAFKRFANVFTYIILSYAHLTKLYSLKILTKF